MRRYLAADAAEQAVERDKARERARKQKKKMAKLKMEAKKLKQEAEVRRAAKAKEKLEQKAAQEAAIAARQSAERVFTVNEMQHFILAAGGDVWDDKLDKVCNCGELIHHPEPAIRDRWLKKQEKMNLQDCLTEWETLKG